MNPRFLNPFAALALVVSAAVGCGGSVDNRPAKWSYIYPVIIQPNCATANCHSTLSQRKGVKLDTIEHAYNAAKTWGGFVPNLRSTSKVYPRMPPDAPMPDPDIALIESWSDAGKPWDGPGAEPSFP